MQGEPYSGRAGHDADVAQSWGECMRYEDSDLSSDKS